MSTQARTLHGQAPVETRKNAPRPLRRCISRTVAVACAGLSITTATAAADVTMYHLPHGSASAAYGPVATGADGNVWFLEHAGDEVGRITPTGKVTEFPGATSVVCGPTNVASPGCHTNAQQMTAGPDGSVWFTRPHTIARITPQGVVTEFGGLAPDGVPYNITAGPDGNLWFTERNVASLAPPPLPGPAGGAPVAPAPTTAASISRIGKITPSGVVTEFSLPSNLEDGGGIASGPDGNIWLSAPIDHVLGGGSVVKISPATGHVIAQFDTFPDGTRYYGVPFPIVAGADGNIWMGELGDHLARVSPAGQLARFSIAPVKSPEGLVAGPDGNVWFTYGSWGALAGESGGLGYVKPGGEFNLFPQPELSGVNPWFPEGITVGSDGNLWFTDNTGAEIGTMRPDGTAPPKPAEPETAAPVAVCDGYWVKPGAILNVPSRGYLKNDSDPNGLALTGHVDHINFGISSHPYRFNATTGALWFKPGAKPFRAVISYHVTNSSGVASNRTIISIYVRATKPSGATLKSCNQPPVAVADSWAVLVGHAADENVLENDSDPDGDPITARVVKISFAAREYSGVDRDGGFLYTAGPGTTRTLRKVITYVAVDSHGAESAPARAVIRITVRQPAADPTKAARSARVRGAASTAAPWDGPWTGWGSLCFDSGVHAQCWFLLSVARAAQFNRETQWTPSSGEAARMCLQYGLLPMKNAACAKKLLAAGVDGLWNKSVINNAASGGDCLLYRVARHRSLRHPRAGVWGSPEYRPLDSLVRPYNGNPDVSGYATWTHGLTGTWRLPLWCDANGNVYRHPRTNVVEAP